MKEIISAQDIVADIYITRSQYNGTFLIVEGEPSDLPLYRRLFNLQTCQIIPAHNKENALEAIDILDRHSFSGVLAIVDADFWHLEGTSHLSSNVFTTDTHDLETMILESPALDILIDEYGSSGKIKAFIEKHGLNIRQLLLECGHPIGYLRWISHKENLSLYFDGMHFRKFLCRREMKVDINKLVNHVRGRTEDCRLTNDILASKIHENSDINHNLWDVCCGHDLTNILYHFLKRALGNRKTRRLKSEDLECSLRLSYELKFFFRTQLYTSLKSWESSNKPFRIFT